MYDIKDPIPERCGMLESLHRAWWRWLVGANGAVSCMEEAPPLVWERGAIVGIKVPSVLPIPSGTTAKFVTAPDTAASSIAFRFPNCSSCLFNILRSLARRFWNQIFTCNVSRIALIKNSRVSPRITFFVFIEENFFTRVFLNRKTNKAFIWIGSKRNETLLENCKICRKWYHSVSKKLHIHKLIKYMTKNRTEYILYYINMYVVYFSFSQESVLGLQLEIYLAHAFH